MVKYGDKDCRRKKMANILRKIIENDKGEIKKLEKTAKKVESYADAMAALFR